MCLAQLREVLALAIGFVDYQRVGEFQDAFLDALQLVTAARQHQHHEEVHHAGDLVFALAYPHGLDQDHVVAGGFAQQHGLAGLLGNSTEVALGG